MKTKNRMTTLLLGALAVAAQTAAASGAEAPTEEEARREQLRIAVQEICPISGHKLGSMGDPIKVTVGDLKEEVYLCCQGCTTGEINPEHWAKVHANIAAAQGVCPIMGKRLPAKSKWTVVEGQIVYVCCPPCIKKIEAEPQVSLAKVDAYYTAHLEAKQQENGPSLR